LLFMVATVVMIGLDALLGLTIFRRSQLRMDNAAQPLASGDPT